MSIKSNLVAVCLILCAATAKAAVIVDVTTRTWASTTTTAEFNPLSIPRHQMTCTDTDNEVVIFSSNFPYADRIVTYIDNFDESPFTPVAYDITPGVEFLNDHSHTWAKGDTSYVTFVDNGTTAELQAFRCNGGTITHLFTTTLSGTDGSYHVRPIAQVATSDTFVMVVRSPNSEAPSAKNFLFWRSTDAGQTWDSVGYVVNWSSFSGRMRIGLEKYDGSVMLVVDSNDQWVVNFKYNRATGAWDRIGRGANVPTGGYRAFGGGTYNGDTSIVDYLVRDNAGGTNDTLVSSRKNKGEAGFTNMTKFLMSTADAIVPYTASSYIESSDRFVLFYNKNVDGNVDNFHVYMRFVDNATGDWSQEYAIDVRNGRGGNSYKINAPAYVPAVYGDKTYVMYSGDSTAGATNYHLGYVSEVAFTEIADTISITTLPYTLADDSTVYVFGEDVLTSNTYALTIANGLNNVVIDGQGDTIKFGQSGNYADTTRDWGSQDNWALWMRNLSAYNVTLRNVVFMFDPPAWKVEDSTYPLYGGCVRMGAGIVNLRIENCRFLVKGRNSKVMWGDWSGNINYNIDIINCTFVDSMNAYYRRDQWGQQAMINFEGINQASSEEFYGIPFQYHLKMQGCSTEVAYWCNLHLEGDSTVAEIYENTFVTDGWNRLDGSPFDQGDVTSATENYCVSFRQGSNSIADGVRIKFHDNTLIADSIHAGGRGIFISGVEGINPNYDDSCLAIYDNYIFARQGFDGYAQTNNGIIAREDWSGLRIYNNEIWAPVYATPPGSAYGYGPSSGIRITSNYGGDLYCKHNTIYAFFADSNDFDPATDGKASYCIMFDENEQNTSGLLIDSNHFFSNNVFVRWGFSNGHGGNPQMLGNRFSYYDGTSPGGSKRWTAYLGYGAANTRHAYPNYYIDPLFDSAVSDTHIYVDQTEPDSLSFGLKYTITATVVDTLGLPVEGATVTFTNNYAKLVGTETTNNAGQATCLVKTWEEFSSVFTNPDSTSFNPFTIAASKAGDNADTTMTIAWNAKTVTIELGATGGGVDPADAAAFLIKDKIIFKDGVRIGRRTTDGYGIDQSEPLP